MTRRCGTRVPIAVASLVLALAASACTADPGSKPEPEPVPPVETSPSTAPTLLVEPGPLDVGVVRVRGRLPRPEAQDLRRGLRRAIGRWMASSFTGGPLPRTDFADAYVTYTDGAARLARRHRAVTTNASLGPELVELVPTRRTARVSALGVRGRAVGASAQVLLVVVGARGDGTQVELVVRGELDLTPTGRGWKVFGFDLRRSVGAPGTYAAAREREERRDRARQNRQRQNRQRKDSGGREREGPGQRPREPRRPRPGGRSR